MDAAISTSEPMPQSLARPAAKRIRTPIVPAAVADHAAVEFFLGAIFDRSFSAEFRAACDDPNYRPSDRLLLRRGQRLLGHARISRRQMQFDFVAVPAFGLHELCIIPSLRRQGYGAYLLGAAEEAMIAAGAVVGWLRTSVPHFFRRAGWGLCGRHNYSRADARSLLVQLRQQSGSQRRHRPWHIRPWRQWEAPALARIYRQNLLGAFGRIVRDDAYWNWLLMRPAFDEIYVAIEGPEQLELGERNTRIIGYAVVRGTKILELLTSPDRPRVALELLARIAADAIEQDRSEITLYAPPEHPLHSVFLDAGGLHQNLQADRGEVSMAKVLDPIGLLRTLTDVLRRRVERASIASTIELGIFVEGRKYLIEADAEGLCITGNRLGRSYLAMNVADFTRLLLGQLDWDWALRDRRIECSTALAQQFGRILFPTVPLYRPVWDEWPLA